MAPISRCPHHRAAACTDATVHPLRGHHIANCYMSGSVRSPGRRSRAVQSGCPSLALNAPTTWGLGRRRFAFTCQGGRYPIAACIPPPDNTVNQRESSLARFPIYRSPSRLGASASSAKSRRNAKNAGDCPIKRPMAVRNLRAAVAAPVVLVGRIMEHAGRLLLKNTVGSGRIRFVWKSSPPNGGALRSGNTSVESLGSVKGGAFPALSCQV